MNDLFPDELMAGQAAEIERLKARIAELETDCRKLNMVYKQADIIATEIGVNGGLEWNSQSPEAEKLLDVLSNYDKNEDIKDKYKDLWDEE